MKYQVIRTHLSPYQSSNFLNQEKELINNITSLNYMSLNEADHTKENLLITNTHTTLSKLPVEILKNTKLIVHPNSGYDHFIEEEMIWQNIPVVIGHNIRAQAVAEYTIATLFEALTDLPQHISWFEKRTWDRTLLSETNIWVFGYGHIGKKVADSLGLLGAKITVVDPFVNDCPHKRLNSWKEGNLSDAKAVLVCASLNKTSEKMFNAEFFKNAHPSLLFINGARGKLVNETDLRSYLLSHPEAFAFLDVFENEPFTEDWHHFPQVWKTSHIAGVFKNLDQKILDFEIEVIKDFLNKSRDDFYMKYKNELLQNKRRQGVII